MSQLQKGSSAWYKHMSDRIDTEVSEAKISQLQFSASLREQARITRVTVKIKAPLSKRVRAGIILGCIGLVIGSPFQDSAVIKKMVRYVFENLTN